MGGVSFLIFKTLLFSFRVLCQYPEQKGGIAKLEATISSLVPLCGIESGLSLFSLWLRANLS
jgi:hypothetical protein